MIYLASGYSGTPEEQEERFLSIEDDTAYIISQGIEVFSPIVYAHAMAIKYNLPKDAKFWESFNNWMINKCEYFWLQMTPASKRSTGVRNELDLALSIGREVSSYRGTKELIDLCIRHKLNAS